MNIAFAGFRHSHIFSLYEMAKEAKEVNIIGCFERDRDARAAAANTHGINFNFASYEQLLTDEAVKAVAIGDYYGVRGAMVIAALKAGKHVICDKPICTSLSELDVIENLCQQKGLVVSCMLDLRYMAQTEEVKRLILGGEIGRIHNVSFTGQHCLDYGKRPSWYFEEGKHGGTINDIAIHGVDLVRYLTEKNLTAVKCAVTKNAYATEETDFHDCAHFIAELEDITLMADVSYSAPKFSGMLPTYWDFYFWGSEGMIEFNLATNEIHIYKSEERIIRCPERKIEHLFDFIKEIDGEHTLMESYHILSSQRQTLTIQAAANK
ncbi:MAG: Gfo/Idh/MocA family oxidoreductase [Clostridia bacterium]|nr:Gfo/Idh/MocA family oxidoreductase [Clostridia bacterium]